MLRLPPADVITPNVAGWLILSPGVPKFGVLVMLFASIFIWGFKRS
jgi:hypothetical protein